MKKILFAGFAALALLAFTSNDGGQPFTVQLSGANEAPGPGDPDGSGTAMLRINQGQGTIMYEVEVSIIGTVVGAHIHHAPAGVAGGVVVPLSTSLSGVALVSKELAKDIRKNPGEYYVNVHTTEYPAGAIRGQLSGD